MIYFTHTSYRLNKSNKRCIDYRFEWEEGTPPENAMIVCKISPNYSKNLINHLRLLDPDVILEPNGVFIARFGSAIYMHVAGVCREHYWRNYLIRKKKLERDELERPESVKEAKVIFDKFVQFHKQNRC